MAPGSIAISIDDGVTRVAMRDKMDDATSSFDPVYLSMPLVLSASSMDYEDEPVKRKGPKDSTHIPFYRNLPKFKRHTR